MDCNNLTITNNMHKFGYTERFMQEKQNFFRDNKLHQCAKQILHKFTVFFFFLFLHSLYHCPSRFHIFLLIKNGN